MESGRLSSRLEGHCERLGTLRGPGGTVGHYGSLWGTIKAGRHYGRLRDLQLARGPREWRPRPGG